MIRDRSAIVREILPGAVLVGFAVLYWTGADAIPHSALDGHVGASGLPKLLAWALGIIGALMVARGLGSAAMAQPTVARGAWATDDGAPSGWYAHVRALGMLAIAAAYVALLPTLGYGVAIAALLFGVAVYSGAGNRLTAVAFGFSGALVLYVLFVVLLKIKLPAGILAGAWRLWG